MSLIFITSGATRAGEVRAGTADCADARLQKRMNGETRAKKEQMFFILVTDLRTGSEVPQNGGTDGPQGPNMRLPRCFPGGSASILIQRLSRKISKKVSRKEPKKSLSGTKVRRTGVRKTVIVKPFGVGFRVLVPQD